MKTTTTMKATAVLILAAAMTAGAQGPRGFGDQRDRGPQGDEAGMRPPPPAPEEVAADMLKQFDTDGDQKLDETELKEAFSARHQPPTPEGIAAKWMEKFDADGNGCLSPEELAGALEANRPRHGRGGPGGPRGDGPRGDGPQGSRGEFQD